MLLPLPAPSSGGFPLAESVRNLVFPYGLIDSLWQKVSGTSFFSYGLNGFPLEEEPQNLVFFIWPSGFLMTYPMA